MRGVERIGFATAARARERVFSELASAAALTRPAMIYGGGNSLAATAVAARRAGVPFALDLEDFHSHRDPSGPFFGMTEKIERQVLPRAAFLTGGSRAIAMAYRSVYGMEVIPIHNVFRLPKKEPPLREWDGNLRLYWFGQTIGPGRGIEATIRSIGAAGIRSDFAIRGSISDEYRDSLRALAADVAPLMTLTPLPPAPPDEMVELCRPHDVGIAMEGPDDPSTRLSLSNKLLTYILAGLAVAMTDTPGQHEVGTDLAEGALVCRPDDIDYLARGLKKWSLDPVALARAKAAAWDAARRRWHWDHAEERGRMIEAVARTLG